MVQTHLCPCYQNSHNPEEDKPKYDESYRTFCPGVLYYIGNAWIQFLKKFLIPAGVGAGVGAAVGLGVDDEGDDGEELIDCPPVTAQKEKVRRSELPIYIPDPPVSGVPETFDDRGIVETAVGEVRKELWIWYDHCQGYREKLVKVMVNTKEEAEVWLEYLKEEENVLPRAGAIGVSSLAGLVLGLRRGRFKKLLYGTAGGLAMASLCYPREAQQYSYRTVHYLKKYCVVGYNFIYGVTPDSLRSPLPNPADLGVVLAPKEDSIPVPEEPKPATKVTQEVDMDALVTEQYSKAASPANCPDPDLAHTRATPSPSQSDADMLSEYKLHPVSGLVRDQSNPADKDLYTNRS